MPQPHCIGPFYTETTTPRTPHMAAPVWPCPPPRTITGNNLLASLDRAHLTSRHLGNVYSYYFTDPHPACLSSLLGQTQKESAAPRGRLRYDNHHNNNRDNRLWKRHSWEETELRAREPISSPLFSRSLFPTRCKMAPLDAANKSCGTMDWPSSRPHLTCRPPSC